MMQGSYIRKLRTSVGLSQKELAEKLGYMSKGVPNRSHIARIEGGHQKVTERLILAVKYVVEKTALGQAIEYDDPLKKFTLMETVVALTGSEEAAKDYLVDLKAQETLAEPLANDSITITLSSDSDIP